MYAYFPSNPLLVDMFDEMSHYTKEKERLRAKGYATIQTNLGNLNVELHGDRVSPILSVHIERLGLRLMSQAPKTVFNWIKLAKQGKYDNVIFHRLIPGFMVRSFKRSVSTTIHISLLIVDSGWRPYGYRLGRFVVLGIEFPR